MKRTFVFLFNIFLFLGLAIVAYVLYASAQHAMNWTKLVLFWFGCGAVAVFLLYHLFARMPETWLGRRLRRYSLLHRAVCAVLLILGIYAAAAFSNETLQRWQLPALYWEPVAVNKISREHFEIVFDIGNQREQHALQVRELQLVELSDPKPPEEPVQVSLRLDSLALPASSNGMHIPKFFFAETVPLAPLEKRRLTLTFQIQDAIAIHQIQALYHEHTAVGRKLAFDQYILFERNQAAFIDFAGLVARSRQPSYLNQSHFIYAVGRSRHPAALEALQELLRVHDVRIQNMVCDALAALGDTRAAPALIALVEKSKNPQALRALGYLRSKIALEFLMNTLQDEREAFLRAEAAEALGRIAVPAEGDFARAIPVLAAKLRYGANEDVFVQREAMLGLARISDTLAIPVILEHAKRHHSGQALRNIFDVTTILGDKWLLPMLGNWLQDWHVYNLDQADLQLLLDYVVATKHHDMVQILIDALEKEFSSTEVQARIIRALYQLTGKNFGELRHSVFNLATERSNRRVLSQWQSWWKQAQHDSLFREQIKPIG
ncbi:MAG: HEAT repeat domain-containing protein [bacterium]